MKTLFLILAFASCVAAGGFISSGVTLPRADGRYINIADENDIFEIDAGGDVMPSVNGKINLHFEENANGDIQPKDKDCMEQDSNGDYEPIA